ncbi:hypothetical protein [Kangiella sediminilitoris]|uniref:Uncharacterized protein n=1 Tax=Kangiella sediminilitoris TaxID=1144748 RepID=A0A1B3B7M3_9GAMM|nr:hypothetical protein [Kangiella sediminilitoris]AOE48795.1 hypothetical protein KS2013_63 [Kangiella sediminilitoris]
MPNNDNTCWFCEKRVTEQIYQVNVKKDDAREIIKVPACESCQTIHQKVVKHSLIIFFTIAVGGAVATMLYILASSTEFSGSGISIGAGIALAWSIPALFIAFLWNKKLSKGVKPQRKILQYPPLKDKLDSGYQVAPLP